MASTIAAGTTSGTAIAIAGDTSGVLQLQTNGTTAAVTINTSQNVGIGTTSPGNILELKSATPIQIFNQTTGNSNQGIQFQVNGATYGRVFFNAVTGQCDTRAGLNNGDGYYLTYSTDGSERMRIDSSGNLLVGQTAVDSSGGFAVVPSTSASGAPAILAFNKGNAANETCLRFKYQGSQVGSISYSNTTTAYNTSSDYRLKENIAPMTGALGVVQALKPVTYNWKIDGSAGQGFIAHELQAVVPDCVSGEKDAVETYADEDGNEQTKPKYQGVDTSFLVATLTAAIQELNAKVDAQAVRIAELEGAK